MQADLENASDGEDTAANDNGGSATDSVRDITLEKRNSVEVAGKKNAATAYSEQRTEESASRQD